MTVINRDLAEHRESFYRVVAVGPAGKATFLDDCHKSIVQLALDFRHSHQDHILLLVRQRSPQHSMAPPTIHTCIMELTRNSWYHPHTLSSDVGWLVRV